MQSLTTYVQRLAKNTNPVGQLGRSILNALDNYTPRQVIQFIQEQGEDNADAMAETIGAELWAEIEALKLTVV